MDTTQLKYFIALSRCLNFSEVATQFYVSQPTISHQVKNLEESIGFKLFERDRHNVSITNAGRAFLMYAEQIVELSDSAETQMRQVEEGTDGIIRINCVSSMAQQMTECLNIFSDRYPSVVTEIECVPGMQQIQAIARHMSDVYFSFSNLLQNSKSLELIPMRNDRFCLFLHKKYAELANPHDLSSLSSLPLITYNLTTAPYLTRKVFAICEENSFSPSKQLQYSAFFSIIIAINAGLGFGLMPSHMGDFIPDDCISIPLPGDEALIDNSAGYHRDTKNPIVPKFIEVVKEQQKNT
jgi:DNA-binding transcriptional LysR family regulator